MERSHLSMMMHEKEAQFLTLRVLKKHVGIFTEMFSEYLEGLMENCISQYSANLLIFSHRKTS